MRNPVTGMIMSFLDDTESEFNIEVNRSRSNAWELVKISSVSHQNSIIDCSWLDILENFADPSECAIEGSRNVVADAFVAALQTLPIDNRAYWQIRNKIPSYPWLNYAVPLSV